MVWPFSRKKVIDLTQGELKLPKKTITISDYADLTTSQSQTQMTSPSSSGLGDFFSAVSESASSSTTSLSNQDIEMKGIKNKIEDIEYKIDNLTKKLHDLLDRFEVVERRVTFRKESA